MYSLGLKFASALLAVLVVGLGVTTFLANQTTSNEFRQFAAQGWSNQAITMASVLGDYYQRTGSLEGVDQILSNPRTRRGPPPPPGSRPGRGAPEGELAAAPGPAFDLVLADKSGIVVADNVEKHPGEVLSEALLQSAVPIVVGGNQVGALVRFDPAETLSPAEEIVLQRVNRSIWLAGALAGLLAVVLGVILTRQLTGPLRDLTQAAHRMAQGDLNQRVPVRSKDEVGELGEAFNTMAANLTQADQLRRNLMADVAHELRTPLTLIQGNLEAMVDGVYPPDQDRLQMLLHQSLLLSRLINDVRDLSLAESGELKLEHNRVDLVQIARRALAANEANSYCEGQSLRFETSSDELNIMGDSHRFEQIVSNLLSNALRYTPAGGQITIQVARRNHEAFLSVTDSGAGISAEDLPHVFERFWRGDRSRSRASGGMGLGLAIARTLAELHKGRLEVQSQVGHGSTFILTLPLADDCAGVQR
ncbi:MAG: HAMP domain-containing protein [Chloroflexi bacterium]|nr:HAMP domain-containing protein [Chloroflexota bacterium]